MKYQGTVFLKFAGTAALLFFVFACSGREKAGQADGQAAQAREADAALINYAMGTAWDTLNPYDSASGSMYSQIVWDKIYDRLAYLSQAGVVIKPRNALSWESADGGKAIVFHLNPKAKWHDGVPVTAKDWVFTIGLISSPDLVLAGGGFFSFLEGTDNSGKALSPGSAGAEALDDYTLKLSFKYVTSPESFLILSNRNFYVLPEHLLRSTAAADIRNADFWKKPVGSGPAIFESEIVGNQILLRANPDYHLGKGGFGFLKITVIAASNRFSSLLSGDLDCYAFGNSVSVDEKLIAEQAGFTVVDSKARSGFTEVILNNKSISDPRIRQALHYALDKPVLAQLSTQGLGQPAFSTVIPSSEYYNTDLAFDRDPAKAKALLQESGYDGRRYTMAVGQSRAELVAVMQQQWAEAGINVDIIIVDVATMFTGLKEGKYDIGLSGHTGTAEPLWFSGNFSSGSLNDFSITDPVYDQKKAEINAETDPVKRKKLIWDYQAFLAELSPCIPLWHSGSLYVQSKTVRNIDYDASSLCNENTWEWVKD
ncbi:MAG: ABC transporter substrate-binding protein [Treponema sp.]|jgi:peptide/nickel transport system substrate-binding protein|nr:ABC transporter substrate-binding protein [Treponema sp.]